MQWVVIFDCFEQVFCFGQLVVEDIFLVKWLIFIYEWLVLFYFFLFDFFVDYVVVLLEVDIVNEFQFEWILLEYGGYLVMKVFVEQYYKGVGVFDFIWNYMILWVCKVDFGLIYLQLNFDLFCVFE